MEIQIGPQLFRFESFTQWVNKAPSWFRGVKDYICIDQKGRICQRGLHFMRARDEKTFPVDVYSVDDEETEPSCPTCGATNLDYHSHAKSYVCLNCQCENTIEDS